MDTAKKKSKHETILNEYPVGTILVAKEDIPVYADYYGANLGNGTIKAGTQLVVRRIPNPEKKMFKLETIGKVAKKYGSSFLHLRPSKIECYLEKV